MASGDVQTNFRLPREKYEVIEAAAFVQKKGSVQKLVKQLVEEAIARYAELPTVQQALEAQREQLASETAKVTHLPRRSNGK